MDKDKTADVVPRTPSGDFDVEAGTRRLIEILDKDKNGRVDAREIIDGIHNHPNKSEVIMLLRQHPDPEKALGVVQEDAKDLTTLKSRTPRTNARMQSLREELSAFKGSLEAMHSKKGKQVPNKLNKHKSLMEILDKDGNGHVDAHELISMIREHPMADEVIDMVSKMHDPKHALGVIKAPSKYRRRSVLVSELHSAKMHLKHTRKRLGTLQQSAKESEDLREQLAELKRMQQELKKKKMSKDNAAQSVKKSKASQSLKKSDASQSLSGDESESDDESDSSSSVGPSEGGESMKITRNVDRSDTLLKSPPNTSPSTNRASAIELTLQKHTEELTQHVKRLPAWREGTWDSTKSAEQSQKSDASESELKQLLSPSNHVFIGLWHRTKSILGAWPLCLCGSLASRPNSNDQKVHLGNYDSASGVVWRFVPIATASPDTGKLNTSTNSIRYEEYQEESIHALIECVDHADFAELDSGLKGHRLFLTSSLTLTNDFTKAANWTVSPYHHGAFRNGPGDISVYITLSKWDISLSSTSKKQKVESRGRLHKGRDDRGELVLCAKASTKEVMLVSSSKLSRHDPKTGLFLYDEAWELTPDAEAPIKESMKEVDGIIPLEKYLDDSFAVLA